MGGLKAYFAIAKVDSEGIVIFPLKSCKWGAKELQPEIPNRKMAELLPKRYL